MNTKLIATLVTDYCHNKKTRKLTLFKKILLYSSEDDHSNKGINELPALDQYKKILL